MQMGLPWAELHQPPVRGWLGVPISSWQLCTLYKVCLLPERDKGQLSVLQFQTSFLSLDKREGKFLGQTENCVAVTGTEI